MIGDPKGVVLVCGSTVLVFAPDCEGDTQTHYIYIGQEIVAQTIACTDSVDGLQANKLIVAASIWHRLFFPVS